MKERHHRNILSVASFDICRYCPCCLTFLYRSYRVDLSKEKRKYRMAKSKKIVMTGGGTAGHVTPNIALMPALQEAGYEITYIGSYNGMEKELIEAHFLTCFVALTIARILENKLEHKYSVGKILDSLSKAECSLVQQNYYLFDYYDEVLREIGLIMDIDFGKRIRTLGEIKKILAKTKK